MSQPPGPGTPYGTPPQQPQQGAPAQPYGNPSPYGSPSPYAQPQPQPQPQSQPPSPYGGQQSPYGGQPAHGSGYGYPAPGAYPYAAGYGYPAPGMPVPGMPPGMPPLASWGARLGALLLDWLTVMLVPSGLITAGYVQLAVKLADRWQDCDDAGISRDACPTPKTPAASLTLMAIGGVLSLAAVVFLIVREGKTGQTPGKRIVGIRLLREQDGSALGFGLAFGRRLLHVLDALPCYLGFLWPLWDGKKQTFADKMAHTVVIRDPR